jgi:hypothetical protein
MFGISSKALKTAAILLPKQHIFLLSHMRSYTSLYGHIMGFNPAICGYYKMHIGYYSWKSLIRQKLLYFESEATKPGFSCMFDEVLHIVQSALMTERGNSWLKKHSPLRH